MNRLIQFRIWDKNEQSYASKCINDNICEPFQWLDHIVIQQYTGAFDVYGNPICEGDYISTKNDPTLYEVIWNNKFLNFSIVGSDSSEDTGVSLSPEDIKFFEIKVVRPKYEPKSTKEEN